MPRAVSGKTLTRPLSPSQTASAVRRLAAPTGTDRYAAGKSLLATAATHPQRIYPHFDALAILLQSDSKIIRWNVLRLLAAVAPVAEAGKIDALLPQYLAFISGGDMISAANALFGSALIARAKPHLLPRIVPAILSVETTAFRTPVCRNVVIGHALDALRSLGPHVGGDSAVRAFVERQKSNPRPATARRAQALLP